MILELLPLILFTVLFLTAIILLIYAIAKPIKKLNNEQSIRTKEIEQTIDQNKYQNNENNNTEFDYNPSKPVFQTPQLPPDLQAFFEEKDESFWKQFAKYKKAKTMLDSIISYDEIEKVAIIKSLNSPTSYQTTLTSCSCPSFHFEDQIPCKHMYALAMKLNKHMKDFDEFEKQYQRGLIKEQ